MCWNAPVAGVFASLETLVLLVMILRTRSPWFKWLNGSANVDSMQRRDNLILPMLMTINIVEWCELGLWLADPEPFPAEGCRRVNTALTHIAGGVVWLQPTFTMIYCRFTGPPNQRPWFTIPLVLAVMTSAGYFISVALGESGKAVYADDERYPTALMWNQTCAYVGPNGYLEWRFKLANLPVLPSMFSYHLFFNFALMFHCFPMGAFVGGGSVFVLCVQFLSMDGSGEAWSMWCWSGCLFIGFYFIANYVDTDTMVIYQGFEPSDPCTQCLPCICPFVEVKDEDAESNASSEAVIDEEAGKSDSEAPLDLRPITATSSVYRLWACRRLQDMVTWQERWICSSQHGFRTGHRGDDVVYRLALEIEDALLGGDAFRELALYFSKCFDRVPQRIVPALVADLGLAPEIPAPD